MTNFSKSILYAASCALFLGACGPASEAEEFEIAEPGKIESPGATTPNVDEPREEVSAQTFAGDLGSAVGSPVATYSGTCTASNDWRLTCGTSGSREVVYVWKAPASGTYNFNTRLSDYDTVLEIRDYKNTSSVLACNDDTPATLQSSIDLNLSSGAHLLILIDGYETACGTARLSIFKR